MKKLIGAIIPIMVVVVLIAVVVYVELSDPLRQDKKDIREYVLNTIPIGTDMDTAQQIITKHPSWEIDWIADDHGYGLDRNGNPSSYEEIMIGEKAMRIHLGEYPGILMTTDVIAFLGFDGDGFLIDVAIREDHDSL